MLISLRIFTKEFYDLTADLEEDRKIFLCLSDFYRHDEVPLEDGGVGPGLGIEIFGVFPGDTGSMGRPYHLRAKPVFSGLHPTEDELKANAAAAARAVRRMVEVRTDTLAKAL